MGLFGGRRKAEQEEAERRQREEEAEAEHRRHEREVQDRRRKDEMLDSIDAWFEALDANKPAGPAVLTDEILAVVGPYPFPGVDRNAENGRMQHIRDVAYMKAAGKVVAEDRYASSVANKREDAPYWTSVREYCEGILG